MKAYLVDAHGHPRFKLEVDIRINSGSCGLLQGHTIDISESGIAAMLTLEAPLREIVELARDASPPPSSSTIPSTTTMFVAEISPCAAKVGTNTSRADFFYRYEARAEDCQNCPLKPQCCPGNQHRGRGLLRTEKTAP